MADDMIMISEADISALKNTLFAQQQLLQQLHDELDAEREASATAATEALSVILRLQEEKALVRMEAEQYRRLSEQRMSHVEESLAITENIVCQKEMEVAALELQVEAYRCRLLSMGCIDIGSVEYMNLISNRDSSTGPEIKCLCKCRNGAACQWSGRLRRDAVHPDDVKPDWLKSVPISTHHEECICTLSDYSSADIQPGGSDYESVLKSTGFSSSDREECKFLNEIKEQLNSLHDEIMNQKVKKSSAKDEPWLCFLREAMLYFWL